MLHGNSREMKYKIIVKHLICYNIIINHFIVCGYEMLGLDWMLSCRMILPEFWYTLRLSFLKNSNLKKLKNPHKIFDRLSQVFQKNNLKIFKKIPKISTRNPVHQKTFPHMTSSIIEKVSWVHISSQQFFIPLSDNFIN